MKESWFLTSESSAPSAPRLSRYCPGKHPGGHPPCLFAATSDQGNSVTSRTGHRLGLALGCQLPLPQLCGSLAAWLVQITQTLCLSVSQSAKWGYDSCPTHRVLWVITWNGKSFTQCLGGKMLTISIYFPGLFVSSILFRYQLLYHKTTQNETWRPLGKGEVISCEED